MIPPQAAAICELASNLYWRGYAFGSTGNISVRTGDEVWITPTGRSFRDLAPEDLANVAMDGRQLGPAKPSKEYPFHLGCYRAAGDRCSAIVHLHCTYSVALSLLDGLDPEQPLPPITPYYFMRVAPLGLVPYHRPGSEELAEAIESAAATSSTLLLANHGMIALGQTLEEAADRAEELEETAKLYFLTRGLPLRLLTPEQIDELHKTFNPRR